MKLTVAVIGTAHALKGEVRLDVRSDDPQRRLTPGSVFETIPPEAGPLTLTRTRHYKGYTYALFDESTNRDTAEALRGVKLVVDVDGEEREEDAYYAHELVGLEVLDTEGYTLGDVIGVEHMPTQELILVREPDGIITRVPFVRQIVTEVDIDDNCIVVDPPKGLFSDEPLETE